MKTENDFGLDDGAEALEPVDNGRLFTDGAGGGDFDGADRAELPTDEIEAKSGGKMLRLTMPNGHVYLGKDRDELLEQVYKGKVAADQAILDRENQIKTLKAAPAPATQRQQVNDGGDGEWGPDKAQKYLDMLGTDPLAAKRYLDRFDGASSAPDPRVDYAYNVAQRVDQQLMAAEFYRRNPDFPSSEENAQKLLNVVQARGLTPNLVNLEWGLMELKRSGEIATNAGGAPEYEDVTFGGPPTAPKRQSRGAGAPSSPKGAGGGRATADDLNVDTMPLADLKTLLQKKGALNF